MMKLRHPMPFGTEVLDDGRVRFRLWAPAAKRVALCLDGDAPQPALPMAAEQEGWFGLITELATTGTYYQFEIDGGLRVPDPASRFQPRDVHGPSQVIDPQDWDWRDKDWAGRPWEEAVIYELHVGTFTPDGTFSAVKDRLDHLVELGVTAIELMPVADFPGRRNWGYDGALLFAPDNQYGSPNDLKDLIQTAHAKGLMVFLDVVYNHFGPEGNYLHAYAPLFFTERHHTPWGAAINYDSDESHWVRQFFIQNALYWLEEYHFDGLRLDAVHAILDDSKPDILVELSERVHSGPGKHRPIHLILENYDNAAHYLARGSGGVPRWYVAQWNDDIHHVLHVLLTPETGGYYADYADNRGARLGRCLSQGFAYQGEPSAFMDDKPRGEPSAHLPPMAFVSFLQNHDQVGNRALGERITDLAPPEQIRAALAMVLLAPSPPLLFMGEEWGAPQPFLYFCDFGEDLADKVTKGRRQEFARFPEFSDPAARQRIPDPNDFETFQRSVLDWSVLENPPHKDWLDLYRGLLRTRRETLFPRLAGTPGGKADYRLLGPRAVEVHWELGDEAHLTLLANLDREPVGDVPAARGDCLYVVGESVQASLRQNMLPAWSVAWFLHP
jgi:maltooligosyltrehalose trehalohydrolase